MDRYDVVVVGAGAFGLGSAYHLARRGAGRIALVDSLPGPGQGNTGRSVGGFRKGLFTSELNRMLSESTVAFLADLQRSGVDLGMHSVGYLVLLNGPQLEANERAIRELVRRGNARLIDAGELKGLVPWMRLEFDGDEEAAILGLRNVEAALFSGQSGYLDVEKLVGYLHREVLDAGVEPRFNERVRRLRLGPVVSIGHPREPLAWQEKRVEALE
ncbi:MAG: FAD-binding oxidoreductase, partial [Nitrososphaeria archaeon]|nr:FAD-binding oxidoreductase [Nitrososphaeria archaeon]